MGDVTQVKVPTREEILEQLRQQAPQEGSVVVQGRITRLPTRAEILKALGVTEQPLPVAEPIVVTGPRPERQPLEREPFVPDFAGLPVLEPGIVAPRRSTTAPAPDLSALSQEQQEEIGRTIAPLGAPVGGAPPAPRALKDILRGGRGRPDVDPRAPADFPGVPQDVLRQPLEPIAQAEGTIGRDPSSSLERVTQQVLRGRQERLQEMGFTRRAVGAAATGFAELGETLFLPPSRAALAFLKPGGGIPAAAEAFVDPSRPVREFAEAPTSGGGLVQPMHEDRNFVSAFGIGLAGFLPELTLLGKVGAFGAALRGSAPARTAIVGALETAFGKRAAVRIFASALEESAMFGLTLGTFESTIGRGVGQNLAGKVTVFGEELLAGVEVGVMFGGGRGILRELFRAVGPISKGLRGEVETAQKAGQRLDPEFAMARVADRLGMSVDDATVALEGESSVLANFIRSVRSAGPDIPPMRQVRAERTLAAEEARQQQFLDPLRQAAQELRDQGTVTDMGAMRFIQRAFPRASPQEVAQVVSEIYGVRPSPLETGTDTRGIPMGEAPPPPRGEIRADLSRQVSQLEVQATAAEERLKRQDVDTDQALEETRGLMETADRLLDEASQARENSLVDRAARLSAKLNDLFENPPEKLEKPEKPKAPKAEPKAPKAEPKAPKAESKPKAEPTEPREPREVPPEAERASAIEKAIREDLADIEAKDQLSRRDVDRRRFLTDQLEGIEERRGPPPEPPAEPPAAPPAAPPIEPAAEPEAQRPKQKALPATERLDPDQRAQFEEIFPEAKDLTDEELAEEIAAQGIDPKFVAEEPSGRRISDLTDEQLISRIEAAGLDVPEAGPGLRDRLLEQVDPGREGREAELRTRVAEEIRGRRAAERESRTDPLTRAGNVKAFDEAKVAAEADPETSFVLFDGNRFGLINKQEAPAGFESAFEAGNAAITQLADAIRQALRELGMGERLFRPGLGDEFVAIVPTARRVELRDRAEAIYGERTFGDVQVDVSGSFGDTFKLAEQGLRPRKKARGREQAQPPKAEPAPPEVPPEAEREPAPPAPEREPGEVSAGERVGPRYEEIPEHFESIREFAEQGDRDIVIVERPDGSTEEVPVRYAVLESQDVSPSHIIEGKKSRRNPAFPDELQTREAIDPEFIAKRSSDADFKEGLLVLKTPTAERGPPIVDKFGITFGGNNRLLIIQRVYEAATDAAKRLREKIVADAAKFGIDPEFIADMDRPVLVRILKTRPKELVEARGLADDLNRTAIQARTPVEEAVLASERLSDSTLKFFDEAFPEEGTIRAFLRTGEGREFLRRLESDAVVTVEQRKQFFDKEGDLTDQGREFIENVMFARAIGSASSINQMPPALRKTLLKAAPTIAQLKGSFDLRPVLQDAIRLLARALDTNTKIRDIVGQQDLFGAAAEFDPFAAQLASFLEGAKTQKQVVDAFRLFRSAAREGEAGEAGQVSIIPTRSPLEAFGDVFGKDLLRGAPRTLRFSEPTEPTLGPREAKKSRFQPTPEQQAKLRERFGEKTEEQRTEAQRGFQERRLARQRRREERERGEHATKGPPVQREGDGGDRPDIPAGRGESGPGESGGGGTDAEPGRNINPTGEPGVSKGQRKREREQELTQERQKERKRLLEEEDARLRETLTDIDDITDIKNVREEIRADIRGAAKAAGIDPRLVDEQLKDIARIQSNLLDATTVEGQPAPGFLVGNAPGTGKTFIGSAVIKEVVRRVEERPLTENHLFVKAGSRAARILIVIPGKRVGSLVKQWKDVLEGTFGLKMDVFEEGSGEGIWHMSAAAMSNIKKGFKWGTFDLVVFDEGHLFSNLAGARRAINAAAARKASRAVLQLTATPFEFPWDFGYLDNLRLWGKGRKFADFPQWLAAHGVRLTRNGRQWYFVKSAREDIIRTLIQIRREMVESGVYTQRAMKMDRKLNNTFVEVAVDEVMGPYYRSVMRTIDLLEERSRGVERNLLKSARVTFTKRINELAKIPKAIELAKRFEKQGKSVILFLQYKMGFTLGPRMAERFPALDRVITGLDDNLRLGLQRIVQELGGEGKVAQIHGLRTQKQRDADLGSAESGTGFRGGEKKFLVATGPAGGTGLSLHDTTGKNPRVQINLTAPWTGKEMEQQAGRSYRFGSKSDVEMIWMGVDTPIERDLLARVAMKLAALGALVQGKVRADAAKMAEFDFLPMAEMEANLFGYKDQIGSNPVATTLAFVKGKGKLNTRQGASEASLDRARVEFNVSLGDSGKWAGLEVKGKVPTADGRRKDLDLPAHPRDIPKPSQIIGTAARMLLARAFKRTFRRRGVKGEFKIVSEIIGLRSFQDVRTAAHELMHFIDKRFFGFLVAEPGKARAELPARLQPFAEELKPFAYEGADDLVVEGMAEFGAEYVMRPAMARKQAPKFFEYFRDHLNRTDPEVLAVMDWMQGQVETLRRFGSNTEQVMAHLAIGDDGKVFGKMLFGRTWLKFLSTFQNNQVTLRVMDKMMMGKDGDYQSLEKLARMSYGADPFAENMMFRGVFDWASLQKGKGTIKRTSKGLPEIFARIDSHKTFNAWRAWTVARHARELGRQGLETGLEDLWSRGVLKGLEEEVAASNLSEIFESTWKDFKQFQDAMLQMLVDSDVLDASSMRIMQKLNKLYVPFQRIMGEPDQLMDWVASVKSGASGVDGLVALPPAIFRFKGSTRMIVDPVEAVIGNVRYFSQLAFRKRVETGIAKFADEVYGASGGGRFVEKIPAPIEASKFTVGQVKQALKDVGIQLPADLSDQELSEILTIFHPMNRRKDIPIFSAMIPDPETGGRKRQFFQINDPLVWNAIAGMNRVEFGWLARLAILFKTTLRTGIVSAPSFMIKNFIRDTQTAWIQTPTRGKPGSGKAAARAVPMVAAMEGLVESIKAGPLWDEFVASGAAGAALNQISRPSNQIYMRKMFGSKGLSRKLSANHSVLDNAREAYRYVKDVGNATYYGVTHVGSVFENANRLSTFKAAREQNLDLLQSGFAGRDVTTDFAVHGSAFAAWRLMTAFANPAIQGLARTGRAFREDPLRTFVRSTSLTALSAGVWWLNRNDPDYPEFSDEVKSRYWIWRVPGTGRIFRVPKTYLYGDVFGSFFAEAFLDWAAGRDPDIIRRLGIVIRQGVGFSVIPNFVLTPLEIALNKSLYFQTAIEPAGIRTSFPPEMRANEFTSESSKALSMAIFRVGEKLEVAGGGRFGERGGFRGFTGRMIKKLNLSPMQYDHLVRGVTGQMGNDMWQDLPFLIRGGKNLVRRMTGDELIPPPNEKIRRAWFIRDFTMEFPTGSANTLRRFYDIRESLAEITRRYVALQLLDPDEALVYYGNHFEEIDAFPLFVTAAAKLSQYTIDRRKSEDREEWSAIQREALELAQDFTKAWGDLTPAQSKLLSQRRAERTIELGVGEEIRDARQAIDMLVFRRQLKGTEGPPKNEIDQVTQIINGLRITGRQRRELIRFYRRIAIGDIVDREFNKTSPAARRRFFRQ